MATMKIITRGVIDWATLEVLEEDCFQYTGPVSLCKSSGSAPQPVDPYTQAAAQYGLSTGTAAYNAGINRTNTVNPIGSSTWSATPGTVSAPVTPAAGSQPYGLGAQIGGGYGFGGSLPAINAPATGSVSNGAPTYTNTTRLAPWAESGLQKPIDTSGIAGMPGGPSTTQDLQSTQDALYQRQMQYLAPEQKLASEQMDSKLANMGATVGSAAYNNEQDRLAREQQAQTSDARTQAITGAGAEQSRLFGLGSQSLQDQITARNAPINEYNSLNGAAGATANAQTPDISGAFGQQYSGALAGYNANVASNNANTQAGAGLASAALLAFLLA